MPKKTKIKRDEIVTDAGLVLDPEQAAMVRRQMYEGSYGLGAPEIAVSDDDITVRVASTVFTVYGDSSLLTTSVLRRSELSGYTPTSMGGNDVEYTVRDAIERARDAAEATIKAINEEWETNVGEPDEIEGDEGDEGLREGPVVGSGPAAEFEAHADIEARHQAFADAVSAERRVARGTSSVEEWIRANCPGAQASDNDDTITLPNAEYADLIADSRRLYLLELEVFSADRRHLEALKLEIAARKRAALEAGRRQWAALKAERRQRASQPFERPVPPDEGAAPAGEIDISGFVAATTGGETASDTSDASTNDGGPVEPELDIDALVAAIDVQASINGLPVPVTVSFTRDGHTATFSLDRGTVDGLRKALADAQRAGGLR